MTTSRQPYIDRHAGAVTLSDHQIVRITKELGAATAVAEAIRLRGARVSPAEASRITGVHVDTVDAWIRAGAVRAE